MNAGSRLTLDPVDRRLITVTQAGLPLVLEPYAALAAELGTTESDVLDRLSRMQASGAIRRIGVVPNHFAIGYRANAMSVWNVADTEVDRLGIAVGALPFVTHCYRRPRRLPLWPFNLFAMVHGRDRGAVGAKIDQIAAVLGAACTERDVLYSRRILKKTGVRLRESGSTIGG